MKIFSKNSRGFTLIELLIVIAIIGILSGIVMVVLNMSRDKARDASVKGSMSSFRTQAELYLSGNSNSYTFLFTGDNTWASANTQVQALLTAVAAQNGSGTRRAGSSDSAWAAQAQLPSTVGGTASYFCVDSTGNAKIGATLMVAGDTVCPG